MQVHAFDKKELIDAAKAQRRKDYACPECLSPMRLRKGKRCSAHFFHLRKNRLCRQSNKGPIHLKLQQKIRSFFEDAKIEVPFPSIGRIADVACSDSKIIYEVQYSPMSAEEAKARTADYASIGYEVIWILHDHTFNKWRKSPLELYLRSHPCYYSNIDEKGEGTIYDQLDRASEPTAINLKVRRPLPTFKWPRALENRVFSSSFYHEGDLIDRALKGDLPTGEKKSLKTQIKEIYLGLLHMALERSSR